MVRFWFLLISGVILQASTRVQGQAPAVEDEILCPFLKNMQPDTSSNRAIVNDVVQRGNLGLVSANFLVYTITMLQQGPLALATGRVLDLQRLDEVLIVSHPDLYTRQLDGVEERILAAADDEGFITIDDLFAVKEWVAAVTGVSRISAFNRSETIALFLSAGGNLDDERVLADNVIRYLRNDWDVADNGPVNLNTVMRGFFISWF